MQNISTLSNSPLYIRVYAHFRSLHGMMPFQAHSNSTAGNLGSERSSDKSLAFVTALLRDPRSRAASHVC